MTLLSEHTRQLLEAAQTAGAHGESCSNLTLLLGPDGAIRMIADSDWPLEDLIRHHAARAAYRVHSDESFLQVEGRLGHELCVMRSARRSYVCANPAWVLLAGRN